MIGVRRTVLFVFVGLNNIGRLSADTSSIMLLLFVEDCSAVCDTDSLGAGDSRISITGNCGTGLLFIFEGLVLCGSSFVLFVI